MPRKSFLARRLWALALRHVYLHIGSWPRIVEMLYWPMVNMAMWGFTSVYLVKKISHTDTIGAALVAGVILNEIFLRISITTLMLFLEEVWSRNLGHLFASPLRVGDYALGLIGIALIRSTLALIPAAALACWWFGFSPERLGWPLVPFVLILAANGCLYGLVLVGMLLRFGLAAEWLAWMASWVLLPFFAPYYPVSILPGGLQLFAHILPPTYVFESMKSLLNGGGLEPENLLIAGGLTVFYGILAAFLFWRAYCSARRRGGLLQTGE